MNGLHKDLIDSNLIKFVYFIMLQNQKNNLSKKKKEVDFMETKQKMMNFGIRSKIVRLIYVMMQKNNIFEINLYHGFFNINMYIDNPLLTKPILIKTNPEIL